MSIQKTNVPGYVKDTETHFVTNKNDADYEAYKRQRAKILENESLEKKINTLEDQLGEMYDMLKKITNKV